ncbi:MAG: hypothetical protein GEU79_18015, partial [Acidimicrobiia bacterium]|nr:hypothetical protein [Acidimicrobiia bacterium]
MKTWLSRRPFVVDTFIAVLLMGLGVLEIRVNRMSLPQFGEGPLLADIAWSAVTCLPLIWRRVYPLTVMVAVVSLAVAGQFAGVYSGSGATVAMFLAVYSSGAYSHHNRRDLTRGLLVVGVMALLVVGTFVPVLGHSDAPVEAEAFLILLNTAFFSAAWILGDVTRQKHSAQARLEKQAEVLQSQREELAQSAVASERLRIARELHDVVGHHVSVMGVQAGAARRLIDHDPEKAGEVLSAVEESGRDAVTEMGRLVGLLRSDGDETPGPQPGFADLDAMIERMGDAGLDVTVRR